MTGKKIKHKSVGTELTQVEFEATDLHELVEGEGETIIVSNPPSGKYKVVNLFVDPSSGRLTVQYDDTPIT